MSSEDKMPRAATEEDLLALLESLARHQVDYVLIGGCALNIHGYMRFTSDIDLLLPMNEVNGKRVIDALMFLPEKAASEMSPEWLAESGTTRVFDEITVDLMTVAANGETYESLRGHIKKMETEKYGYYVLDLEGLLKTKNSVRPKDKQDAAVIRSMLSRNASHTEDTGDRYGKGLLRFLRKMLRPRSAGTDAPQKDLEIRNISATEETRPTGPALRVDGSSRPETGGNAPVIPKTGVACKTGDDEVRYAGRQETAEPDIQQQSGDLKPE
jgi:hypothetical protein